MKFKLAFLCVIFLMSTDIFSQTDIKYPVRESLVHGSNQMNQYLPWIEGKKIAVVANHTSMVGKVHLVDTLVSRGVQIKVVFAPEHGFRGDGDAGEHIKSSVDQKTGIPVVSLYGEKKKPSGMDLEGIQAVVFDIQDVGARFYTYISTMQYVMEACADAGIVFIVLDRPNPNGFYVDGPVLDMKYASFVGMNPIPVVHGLTIAEYARMITGEQWIRTKNILDLKWVTVTGYDHKFKYNLPIRPSPNLPNMASVYLYPSLCLFEGTIVSVGRGTDKPFQVIGFPGNPSGDIGFVPKSVPGAKSPPYLGKSCSGYDLQDSGNSRFRENGIFTLEWLIGFYQSAPEKEKFFNSFFDKLAGNAVLKDQIRTGMSETDIRATWQYDLNKFKEIRKKYLLYEDFD